MSEPIRCPSCGGLNPATADWCGQCLARFTPPPPPEPVAPPAPVPVAAAPPSDTDPAAPAASSNVVTAPAAGLADGATQASTIPAEAIGTTRGAFKVTATGIVWKCARCDTENLMEEIMCTVCMTPFADVVNPPVERPQRDPGTAALYSLFFPGAGHAFLGLWGQAVARGIISLWVIGVAAVAALQGGKGGSRSILFMFGFISLALWLIAAHDAFREANNEPGQIILKNRYFIFLVMGLLGLLFGLLMVGFMGAQSQL